MDILINAAGGNHPSATASTDLSFFDLPVEALNLLGTILPCRVFGRGLVERGEGSGRELHAVVGSPHGAELFPAHSRQCHRSWFFYK